MNRPRPSTHPQMAVALASELQTSHVLLTAGMSAWLTGSASASVPTDATLDSLDKLDARLAAVNSADEAAVLELVAQLRKALESVHLFGQ